MKWFFSIILLFSLPIMFFSHLKAQPIQKTDSTSIVTIVVEPGDWLSKLAADYLNDMNNWPAIYKLNKDLIENPDKIYVGQKLRIPRTQANKEVAEQTQTVLKDDTTSAPNQPDSTLLKEFRKAFEKLAKDTAKDVQEKSFEYLNIGGMVLDETHSKLGNDFYNIFYSNWKEPQQQLSFTIVVSEQPTPSLGTIVFVKIDGQPIFKHRLEPRYYKTEQAAKTAVYRCQQYLNSQISNRDPYYGI